MFFICTFIALPHLQGSFGLLGGQEWARVLLIGLGVVSLFGVPVGTLVGGYTFWVLEIKWEKFRLSPTKPTAATDFDGTLEL